MEKHSENPIAGQHIIYFGPGSWDGMWRNRHQLMSRFARDNRVLYVEPQVSAGKGSGSQRNWLPRNWSRHVHNNLYVFQGPNLPTTSMSRPLKGIFRLSWKLALKRTIRRLRLDRPIIWYSHPNMYPLSGWFSSRLMVYHIVDEYGGYTNVNAARRARIEAMEGRMLARADLALVVSQKLLQSKRDLNPDTYLIPNGVDYDRFSAVADEDSPVPADVAHIPTPIIGYAGLISARLDLELIERLAQLHADWSFILVGEAKDRHCRAILDRMRRTGNIHFTGPKKVTELPSYVKRFDVGLIPYQINRETKHADPLKMYEYMAMGKPVVSTPVAAARAFEDIISIVENASQAETAIAHYLNNDNHLLATRSRQIAAANTWDKRVEQISTILSKHLNSVEG